MVEAPLTNAQALQVRWLGTDVEYGRGMQIMREAMQAQPAPVGELLLLEHAATITTTRSGGRAHLLVAPEELQAAGIALVETDRGGDVTFHGPGQLVGYPVLPLCQGDDGRVDLLGYVRALELGLIEACQRLGIQGAHRKAGMTGVWIASDPGMPAERWPEDEAAAKLIAIGVGVKQGVTRHGFALNMRTDLDLFLARIVPCGLQGRPVTSLERLAATGHLATMPSDAAVRACVTSSVAAALQIAQIVEGADTHDVLSHPFAKHARIGFAETSRVLSTLPLDWASGDSHARSRIPNREDNDGAVHG